MSMCNSEISMYLKVNEVFNNINVKIKIPFKNQSSYFNEILFKVLRLLL